MKPETNYSKYRWRPKNLQDVAPSSWSHALIVSFENFGYVGYFAGFLGGFVAYAVFTQMILIIADFLQLEVRDGEGKLKMDDKVINLYL